MLIRLTAHNTAHPEALHRVGQITTEVDHLAGQFVDGVFDRVDEVPGGFPMPDDRPCVSAGMIATLRQTSLDAVPNDITAHLKAQGWAQGTMSRDNYGSRPVMDFSLDGTGGDSALFRTIGRDRFYSLARGGEVTSVYLVGSKDIIFMETEPASLEAGMNVLNAGVRWYDNR